MATVTNWIDYLNKPAEEVAGAIYPGAGSSEGLLVILAIIIWIGWHVLTAKSESDELERLARKRHGPNDHKSNFTDWYLNQKIWALLIKWRPFFIVCQKKIKITKNLDQVR